MKRDQLPKTVRKTEKHQVIQFTLNHLEFDPTVRGVVTQDVFDAYKKYLKENGFKSTKLSVDGFGKLLPKSFIRKGLGHGNQVLRTIVGVRLI